MRIKRAVSFILSLLLLVFLPVSCRQPEPVGDMPMPAPGSEAGPDSAMTPDDADIEKTRALFYEFLMRDFVDTVTSDTLTLRFLLKNPAGFGITDYEVNWGELGVYPTAAELERDREAIEEFGSFDREMLTKEQKESYDIYAYLISLYETSLDTYMLYDPLTGANGFHAAIPVVMSEYRFYSRADIEEYLLLTEQFGLLMDSHIEYQKERSRLGLFMSDQAADEVIKACDAFTADKDRNIFLGSFEDRVGDVSGLSESEREECIKRNLELFETAVVPAYERLSKAMKTLKGSGVNSGGLARFNKGKEYYRNELLSMGISRSPEELISDCDALLQEYISAFNFLLYSNQRIMEEYDSRLTPDNSAADIVDYLKKKSEADFPALPAQVRYSLYTIDEAVRAALSPGFYFMPPLDDYARNSIYYNPDYFVTDPDYMFFLFAHEGYPGHLLQRVSVLASRLPEWRKILQFKAYTEGYAQYAQYYSYAYTGADPILSAVRRLDNEMDLLLSMRLDLGIHYEGWTPNHMREYLQNNLPYEFPQEAARAYYDFIVRNPLQPIPYYGGVMEIRYLYDRYSSLMGGAFSERQFHEELLKYGAASFSLLREWMDEALLDSYGENRAAA